MTAGVDPPVGSRCPAVANTVPSWMVGHQGLTSTLSGNCVTMKGSSLDAIIAKLPPHVNPRYNYLRNNKFMLVKFEDDRLKRMDLETDFHGDFASTVADEFRHRVQILRSADTEERLLPLKALDMQRLSTGDGGYRMRVTDDFGLELEFRDDDAPRKRCAIVTRMSPTTANVTEHQS